MKKKIMKNVFAVLMLVFLLLSASALVPEIPEEAGELPYENGAVLLGEEENLLRDCEILAYSDIGQTDHQIGEINDGVVQSGVPSDDNRWQSSAGGNQYLLFDLGKVCRVTSTKLYFFYYQGRTCGYRIYVSGAPFDTTDILNAAVSNTVTDTNGNAVSAVVDRWSNTANGVKSDTLAESVYGRYVLLAVTQPTSGNTPGVLEFEVYGEANADQATVDDARLFLAVDKQKSIAYTMTTAGSSASDFTWTSSDESVATVSGGVVTGVSAGTADITLINGAGETLGMCAVRVDEYELVSFGKPCTDDEGRNMSVVTDGVGSAASNGNDGSTAKWQSSSTGWHYVTIDLGAPYKINRVVWEPFFYYNRVYNCKILTSPDDVTYTQVYEYPTTTPTGSVTRCNLTDAVYARYVRLCVANPENGDYKPGAYEVWVFGDTDITPESYDGDGFPVVYNTKKIDGVMKSGLRFTASVSLLQRCDADEYGFIVTTQEKLDAVGESGPTFDGAAAYASGRAYLKDGSIDRQLAVEDGTVFFSGFVYNIPEAHYDDKLVACPYIKIGAYTLYGTPRASSVNDVIG